MAGTPQVGVKAVIENYDQFISGLRQMQQSVTTFGESAQGATQPMQQMGISADQLVSKLAGLGIVREIYGGFKDFMVQGIQTSMAMERMSIGTENLARTLGETGDAMVRAIQEASGGTIGGLAAMQAANQATIMGVVQNKEEMADLTRIAVGLGRAMGKDAVSSLEDMTIALGRNSPRILDNLGLIVKEGVAHEEYAAKIGKTVEALTEEERAYAFRQAALEKGRQTLANIGDTSDTAATKIEQLNTKWGEFQVTLAKPLTAGKTMIDDLIWSLDQLEKGAKAWQYVFGVANPEIARQLIIRWTVNNFALFGGDPKEIKRQLVELTKDVAEYHRVIAAMPSAKAATDLQLLDREYEDLKTSVDARTGAVGLGPPESGRSRPGP